MDGVRQIAAPDQFLAVVKAKERAPARPEINITDVKDRQRIASDVEETLTAKIREREVEKDQKTAEDEKKSELERSKERLQEVADEAFKGSNVDLQISYNNDAERFVYRGVDRNTGGVVREYPPEEVINRIAKLRQIAGILVDTTS